MNLSEVVLEINICPHHIFLKRYQYLCISSIVTLSENIFYSTKQ